MSMTQLAIVFFSAFSIVSFLLFTDIIRDALRRLRIRPEQPHVVLGDDLRGRSARVLSISNDGQHVRVEVGAECWQGKLMQSRRNNERACEVKVGDQVMVNKVDGLTLHVLPHGK